MKTDDYSFELEGKTVCFYHNQTTHRYEIVIDYDIQNPFIISKAKGEAIAQFLKEFRTRVPTTRVGK